MKFKKTLWIGLLSFPFLAPAQEGKVSLSLTQALERAKTVAPKLRQLRALEEASEASARLARGNRYPSVNASAGYTRYSDVPELTAILPAGPVTIFPNLPNGYRTRLEAALPLFTGFRNQSLIEAADRQRDAAGKDLAAGNSDLTLETTVAYWTFVTTSESEQVLKSALASYEAHLKDTQNRQKVGMAARNEVLAVQVERDQSELSLIQARDFSQNSHANLLRLLDYPPTAEIEPSDRLEAASFTLPSVHELVQKAFQARPERAALHARLDAAQQIVRAAKAGWWPQLSATGGYDYSKPNRRILPYQDELKGSWDVGLNLNMNLFEGGKTAASVDQAKAQAEALRQALAEFDQRIRYDVTARVLNLQSAQAAVPVAVRNVEAATENLKVSQNRYRAGVIPSSDLLDAETALLRSGLRKVDVLARLQIAKAQLDRAAGE